MPTNYRNEQSNEFFAKACASVSKISLRLVKSSCFVVILTLILLLLVYRGTRSYYHHFRKI